MIKYSRIAGLMLVDLLIVNFSYIFALLLRFEFEVNSNQFNQYFTVYADNIVPLTAAALICFCYGRHIHEHMALRGLG